MSRTAAAALLLVAAILGPVQPAFARDDALGGALLGGLFGAIIGGAVSGRGEGAAIGAVIGAAAGAIIAEEGRRVRRTPYYAWREGCYLKRRDGSWVRVAPRYCY